MKKNKLYYLIAILLFLGIPLMGFAQVDVSLPLNLDEVSGDTILVPITVGRRRS
jgi:hypothetical protein